MPQHHLTTDSPLQALLCGVGWSISGDLVRLALLGDRQLVECLSTVDRYDLLTYHGSLYDVTYHDLQCSR